jgi:hypothetical protein
MTGVFEEAGSFDSESASLRETLSTLRMTILEGDRLSAGELRIGVIA